MSPIAVLLLLVGVIWLVVKLTGVKKGQVKCNDCGYIGVLVPSKDSRDIVGAVKQKLVCAKCGSSNFTEMAVVKAQLNEIQRIDKIAKDRIDSKPHCQQCEERIEHEHKFCSNCGSHDIVSHEDWLISPDKKERRKLKIGLEIKSFRTMSTGMHYCSNCSEFQEKSLKFCPMCGNPLITIGDDFLFKKYSTLYPDVIKELSDVRSLDPPVTNFVSTVKLSVSSGTIPIFSWTPKRKVSKLVVEQHIGGKGMFMPDSYLDVWDIESDNGIASGLEYGAVPNEAKEIVEPNDMPLSTDRTYRLTVFSPANSDSADNEILGTIDFTP